MATLHLVSGLPCTGKTTYAEALKGDTDAVVFSLDVWLITMFGRYGLEDIGHEEHTRRVLACRDLTWPTASELLQQGVDVILDDGLFFREHRERYVRQAAAVGATTKIHYLDVPLAVLQRRLAARHADLPLFNFVIPPNTLTAFVGLFEVPDSSEGAEVVVINQHHDTAVQ
jgi:predicted kinase